MPPAGPAGRQWPDQPSNRSLNVTAYLRQVPGLTRPSAGDWAANNISWTASLVTSYQWDR
jgi:hypothetical protein